MFFVLTISSGFGFYNLSVYMNALSEQRGFAVADISYATGLMFITSGVAGIGIARLIDRFDVRWVMVVGAAVGGTALSLMGVATEVWQIWLLFVVFGVGNSGVSLIPGTTIVTRWFPGPNRSVALSVSSTGLSMGGVLLTPFSAVIIKDSGIDAAMPWFGAMFFAAIAPVALFAVRSWPPGYERIAERSSSAAAWIDRNVFKSRFFRNSVGAYVILMGAQVGGIAHLVNHVDKVAGYVAASSSVSVLAFSSIVGRLLGGLIVTRFPIRMFTLINIVGQSIGLAVIALASTRLSSLVGASLFGITVGNLLMLQPLLLAQAYGVARYPKVYSSANAITTLGVAGGPVVMGLLFESMSYQASFAAAALGSLLAWFLFYSAGPLPEDANEASADRR